MANELCLPVYMSVHRESGEPATNHCIIVVVAILIKMQKQQAMGAKAWTQQDAGTHAFTSTQMYR